MSSLAGFLGERRHPALVEAREAIDAEQALEERSLRRVYQAVMVAPSLEVCRALLEGERVPVGKLDWPATLRYGLRAAPCPTCGTPPPRLTLADLNRIPA